MFSEVREGEGDYSSATHSDAHPHNDWASVRDNGVNHFDQEL